ncbi:hypothetical protein KCP71_12500 [Salmonella enterica subsp. enterica]|nr:hypothetical protein KCP71_12500 [Salmonella enterica subsp. enterica]
MGIWLACSPRQNSSSLLDAMQTARFSIWCRLSCGIGNVPGVVVIFCSTADYTPDDHGH